MTEDEQETSGAEAEPAETSDVQERAAETEDYVGVPISDEELGEAWEGEPPA